MNGIPGPTARLVGAAKAGDQVAMEELFARYLPRVARMVAVRLGVSRNALPADAEDLAQDALTKAFSALDRFEMLTPGAFAHWLEAIVLNCVRQRYRRSQAAPERSLWQRYGDIDLRESFFMSGVASPSAVVRLREQNEEVEKSLLALPEVYRRALVGRFVGEMSHGELAIHLGRSEVNARKIVQRALEMLRARCGEPLDA
jgi:RNA polymerase sigma-70 factor (ECF subfamily)